MNEGNFADANKLSNRARRQAENAVKQKYRDMERPGFDTAAPTTVSTTGDT